MWSDAATGGRGRRDQGYRCTADGGRAGAGLETGPAEFGNSNSPSAFPPHLLPHPRIREDNGMGIHHNIIMEIV